ncbi:MAG: GAF domain-containing sensor histidine kinase [Candidatus Omnitrophica bacterium]|nr:GAF domain-containing sensor histidine kinase [Candidatus Omnitrophota bacterium]
MTEKTMQVPQRVKDFFIRVNETVTNARNSEHLLFLISKVAANEFDADRASIFLRDEKTEQLHLVAGTGIPEDIIKSHPVAQKQNISYWVAKNKKPLILNGPVKKDRRFKSQSGTSISSSIIVPLIFENSVCGIFSISRTSPDKPEFTEEDLVIFRFLGDLVVISLRLLVAREEKIHSEQLAAIGLATAEMVHSIKNLLVGIFGATDLIDILIQQGDYKSVKENWPLLADNIKNISTVINDILSYSRTTSVSKENIDLKEIFEQIFAVVRPRCNLSGIDFVINCGDERIVVWGNRDSLYNAFMNIIDNAIRAMPDGGELKISFEPEDGIVKIKISDTGIGIPQENLEKIFEPFFTTDKKKGTGIGLALTKRIVESHSGKINVESKPGSGTSFTIELPVARVQ